MYKNGDLSALHAVILNKVKATINQTPEERSRGW